MTYNFIMVTEAFGFVLALLFFTLMLYTKPRMTKIYSIDMVGMFLSIITSLLHIHIMRLTDYPQNFNETWFKFVCLLYYALYSVLLHLIFTYVRMLSYERKLSIRKIVIIEIFSVCITVLIHAAIIYKGLIYYRTDTSVVLTRWFDVYLIFGMFDALLCFIISIFNRRTLAKIVFTYIMFFVPLDFALLIIQFCYPRIEFVSLTYVLPFMLFYVLFHSNPYNEVIGCQNKYSFETQFIHSHIMRKNYMIINIILPRGHQLDYNYLKNQIIQLTADKCRQIEQVAKHMRLYSLNAYNYAIYVEPKDKADADRIVEQVIEILEAPTNYSLNNHSLVYKMIVFGNHHFIDSTQKLASMQKYLFAKLGNDMKNEHYVATKKDYDDFVTLYNIENLLSDIKSDMNLDDERVICYAQPIYSVETNSFRTAEALMRLDLNGTMIYPDKFIPLAEQNGSIHALTCIILNKVCEKIHELSAEYDFDAITVNCSTLEFSNKDLYKELLDIIRGNDIDCSKIRLELTESAMSDSYELLSANIHKLMDAGIQFYLDDFGTGYSNLERIIGCPFNTIKFDKSLLYKSMDDERMDDLIKSLSEVFKKHGFTLLVEGVENDEQNQYSIKRGFSYIQGYKYAKPVPIAELTSYFQLSQRIV